MSNNTGKVSQIIGPVVDVVFDNNENELPNIYDSLEITNLWVNFASKGTTHNPHTHSNNLFSGVWYPFENTSQTPIMFQDPRPAAGVLLPNVKRHNKYTGSIISMQPKKGMGLS